MHTLDALFRILLTRVVPALLALAFVLCVLSLASCVSSMKPPQLYPPTVEAGPVPGGEYQVAVRVPMEFSGVDIDWSFVVTWWAEDTGDVQACVEVPDVLVAPICVAAPWPPVEPSPVAPPE